MQLSYIAANGVKFRLHGAKMADGLTLVKDSLEGFVTEFEDNPVQLVGFPGQDVNLADRVIKPMTGSFSVVVNSEEVWQQFLRAVQASEPYTGKSGSLKLVEDGSTYRLPVRLARTPAAPGKRVRKGTTLKLAFVSDGGVWLDERSGKGRVTVTNTGVVSVVPVVRWSGAGGQVTLPSGARYTLPRVSGEHSVVRNQIVTATGVDWGLTRQVSPVTEVIPPGKSATFRAPAGAFVDYGIGVMNPWV